MDTLRKEKSKILDFILDEKFIDGLIDSNDLIEEESHDYILYRKEKNYKINNITSTKRINILNRKEITSFLRRNKYDAIFLHSLSSYPLLAIKDIPKDTPIFWFSWGFDIYRDGIRKNLIPTPTLHTETQKIIKSNSNLKILDRVKDHFFLKLKKQFIKQINFHSGVLEYETSLIRKFNPQFTATQVKFNYKNPKLSIEFKQFNGQNILVGNSAMQTNNHLDILRYLKNIDIKGHQIFMPLSYSAPSKEYTDEVIRQYSNYFGEIFHPMIDFMPAIYYFEKTKSCAFAIYYIERQQAIGNINECFRSGRKVFLSESSEVYKYYKSKGYHIFTIQNDLIREDALIPLSEKEQLENYKLAVLAHNKWLLNRKNIRDHIEKYNRHKK